MLSAAAEVREPDASRLRVLHEAYTSQPAEPGSVVIQGGAPLRLLAVIHDLSQDPSWREDWVAAALDAVLLEAERHGVSTLAMPPLGRVHGALPRERFVALLRSALQGSTPRHLARICLVVPEEEVEPFRELLRSRLWL